ncbi:MAG: twin-arginine translocase TatA/TatE family subunit [Lachnospiraceae bacterium]|nr:twin-arginine translocase TatA/TatE family subunit [Lachnospiraceae bacterium]
MKLGTTELLIILAIVVVLFGPSQIPKLTKMFGKATKSFRDGMKEEDGSSDDSHKADTTES